MGLELVPSTIVLPERFMNVSIFIEPKVDTRGNTIQTGSTFKRPHSRVHENTPAEQYHKERAVSHDRLLQSLASHYVCRLRLWFHSRGNLISSSPVPFLTHCDGGE